MEFYELDDKKYLNPLFIISYNFENQFDRVVDHLEKQTSLRIDLYGDTILYQNHVKVIYDFIKKSSFQIDSESKKFHDFIRYIYEGNKAIIFIGD